MTESTEFDHENVVRELVKNRERSGKNPVKNVGKAKEFASSLEKRREVLECLDRELGWIQ